MTDENQDEEFPVADVLEVAAGKTIFKDDGWWKAVVVTEPEYSENKELSVYLWMQTDDGNWKRKQKYKVTSKSDWLQEREVIDELIDEVE